MSRPSCVNTCSAPGRQEARKVTGWCREITAVFQRRHPKLPCRVTMLEKRCSWVGAFQPFLYMG